MFFLSICPSLLYSHSLDPACLSLFVFLSLPLPPFLTHSLNPSVSISLSLSLSLSLLLLIAFDSFFFQCLSA